MAIGKVFQNDAEIYILDVCGNDALIAKPSAYQSYTIAHGYKIDENNQISWAYGDYFSSLESAANKFYNNSYKDCLKHWQYVADLNRSDIYCYGVATSDCGNFKVEFEDDEQRVNYEKLFGENG